MSDIYSVNVLLGADFSGNVFLDEEHDVRETQTKGQTEPADERREILKENRKVLFEQLELLSWIKLDRCQLSDMPEGMDQCQGIQRLSVKHNKLQKLPNVRSGLANLNSLNIRNNHLSNSTAFMYFPKLKEVNFGYNDFANFPVDLTNQKKLRG